MIAVANEWFIVTQAVAPNPTWAGVNGTSVQEATEAAAIAAGALGTGGKAVLLRSITLLQNHGINGAITIFAGNGTSALFTLVIGSNHNSPGHSLDLILPSGLAVKDVLAVAPAGSILVAYNLLTW